MDESNNLKQIATLQNIPYFSKTTSSTKRLHEKMLSRHRMVQIKHKNYNPNSYHFPSKTHALHHHTLTVPPENVSTSTDKIPRQTLGNLWSVYQSKGFRWKMAGQYGIQIINHLIKRIELNIIYLYSTEPSLRYTKQYTTCHNKGAKLISHLN
jgi:hypothetical protein